MSNSIFDLIGIKGKKVIIIPRNDGNCLTEILNKKKEHLGYLIFDDRKGWNCFVLAELHKDMQMSKDCLDEAFLLTNEYWKNTISI